jgi:hypothetical protein
MNKLIPAAIIAAIAATLHGTIAFIALATAGCCVLLFYIADALDRIHEALDRIHDDTPGPVRDQRLAVEAQLAKARAKMKTEEEQAAAEVRLLEATEDTHVHRQRSDRGR